MRKIMHEQNKKFDKKTATIKKKKNQTNSRVKKYNN